MNGPETPSAAWRVALDAALSLYTVAAVAKVLGAGKRSVLRWAHADESPNNPEQVETLCRWLAAGPTIWTRQLAVLNRACRDEPDRERVLSGLMLSAGMRLQDLLGVRCAFHKNEQHGSELTITRQDGAVFLIRGGTQGPRPYLRLYLPNRDRPRFDSDEPGLAALAHAILTAEAPLRRVAGAELRADADLDADQEKKYHGTSQTNAGQ